MGVQDIIVFMIVAGCLFYVGRHLLSFFKKGASGCGCAGCSKNCGLKKIYSMQKKKISC